MTLGRRPYTPRTGPSRPRRERCMADGAKVRTVSDLMTPNVLTATPSETIAEVSTRMGDRKVGSIVVVDGTRPVGILTERDMIRVAASGTDTSIAKVSEWMTENPDTVDPDVDVDDAFHRLTEHGYRHMPVVDNGKLVGIVSLRDLVRIAQIRPVEHPSLVDAPKGLEGVYVAETEIGDVRGQEGFYHYRQYNAVELAEKRSLEDVWYLLYYGRLPTHELRDTFIREKSQYREIQPKVKKLLPDIATAGDHFIPLDCLRTADSVVAYAQDFRPSLDVNGAGDHLHGRRPGLGCRRRHRRLVRATPRRRAQPGPRHARRHRQARERRGVATRRPRARQAHHGVRPPRLQDRGPALPHAQGRGRAPGRRERRVRQAHREDRRRRAGRAQARPPALCQRGVLRRCRHGQGGPAARPVHANV